MSGLRLVLVTRRFWPLVGGAERVMGALAAELASRSNAVTLLTARWHRSWPAELTYHGAAVIRLPNPKLRVWGTLRYMQALGWWLRRHRGRYDLVYVSMLKHDAYAALGAVGRQVPVVLRAEGAGATGDCRWQAEARCGLRIRKRCMKARAIVCPSRPIEREVLEAGYGRGQVHYLPNGVAIPQERTAGTRLAARNALGAVNPALRVPHGAPLAVYTGRLHPAKGLAELVAAWEPIARDYPEARLWLVGEGPFSEQLQAQIATRNLQNQVVLAGVFDSVEEVLAAADLFVLPSWEEGMSVALLEAMAAGLPVVATDIPGNRDLVADGQTGLLVPPRDPAILAKAIRRILADPRWAGCLGTAARESTASRFSLAAMADQHLRLFESLIEAGPTGLK